MNSKQPLWLPPGSVRAILALIVVVVAMGMFALNREVPESLGLIVTAVIVFYFQKNSPTPTE